MEPEKPFDPILHRELHVHDVGVHFKQQIAVLKEIVNYGTNLIPATFTSSEKALGDIVLIPVLLKQVVSMLDGLEVLTSNACAPVAQLQSRAMFEASVYIDFLLQGDTEKKAQYYYVANLRRELLWSLRSLDDTPESATFFDALGEFSDVLLDTKKKAAEPAKKKAESITALLAKEPWKAADDALTKARGKKKHDPAWHVPLGHGSIRDLCQVVGRLHEYEVFYSASSEKMHSSEYKSHITILSGKIAFEPIRNLDGLHATLHWAISVALHCYRVILEKYRPGQIQEFSLRYRENWREAFMSMPHINYSSP